jgi:hypothetical protein
VSKCLIRYSHFVTTHDQDFSVKGFVPKDPKDQDQPAGKTTPWVTFLPIRSTKGNDMNGCCRITLDCNTLAKSWSIS